MMSGLLLGMVAGLDLFLMLYFSQRGQWGLFLLCALSWVLVTF
jgi:hypothetical protein